MTPVIVQGDTRRLPLADESVDLIVTSPPYFALRSYTDDGKHYDGQIGSEDTWQAWLAALVDCTREWVRVLKPSGSLFVDLGDKYSGAQGQTNGNATRPRMDSPGVWRRTDPSRSGIPNKSLMLLPERYRIACVDELDLIARAVITWSKPNALPESATDRVRRSHEDWVYLTRRPRYYSAVDEIRVPSNPANLRPADARGEPSPRDKRKREAGHGTIGHDGKPLTYNPLGALPGSVWSIPTEPLKLPDHLGVDHFAAFPSEWPRRLILGWSPPGICLECKQGRWPVADRSEKHLHRPSGAARIGSHFDSAGPNRVKHDVGNARTIHRITGYACDCSTPDAPTRPAVVLDPFGGTGTTAAVANALGRIGISVDLSHDYSRVARWRCQDEQLAGKVRGRMWADRQTTFDLDGAA